MHIAHGVEMLELKAELMNGPGVLCPALIWDHQNAVLVDAGLPGMAPQFIEAIEDSGVSPAKLTHIIITHHDFDHIGSLAELQKKLPHRVEILSHPDEVPYIQGERASCQNDSAGSGADAGADEEPSGRTEARYAGDVGLYEKQSKTEGGPDSCRW